MKDRRFWVVLSRIWPTQETRIARAGLERAASLLKGKSFVATLHYQNGRLARLASFLVDLRPSIRRAARGRDLLSSRRRKARCAGVFANEGGDRPLSIFTLEDQHSKVRKVLKRSGEFVIHSLRHSMLTRPGESGGRCFCDHADSRALVCDHLPDGGASQS